MELHGIRVVAVEDVSVFIFRAKIINPLSNKFITQFLPQIIPITEERQAVLGEIKTYFKCHSKEHYLRKRIIPIGNTEIPEVKECKLNICTLCFDHCSKRHISEHLKKTHHIVERFDR